MPHTVAFCHTLVRCIDTVKKSMTRCKVDKDHHGAGVMPAQRVQLTKQVGDGDNRIQLEFATHDGWCLATGCGEGGGYVV